MVLHSLKKAKSFGRCSIPESQEFQEYKLRIENVVKTLEANALANREMAALWKKLGAEQKKNAENFMNMYPDDDELRTAAVSAHGSCMENEAHVSSVTEDRSSCVVVDRAVKQYIAEMKNLSMDYKRLHEARTEFGFYQDKMASLEAAKRPDEEKIDRNREKLMDAQTNYEDLLAWVIERQEDLYSKRKDIFKASFVVYWLSQAKYVEHSSRDFLQQFGFGRKHEKQMLELDINIPRGKESRDSGSHGGIAA
uniref:BAR domain-containing protein n=1 Tax=Compsopogon caeruleus TaxID=31354 RepID=A0A6T6ANG6_9RHOD|mmetsp:Transcript_10667/g.21485  ORF Transcript_10667/g.21485 Transcript_10667/m.21485 type:complete len:252 (+) Transcript_10667:176-931(+)|eukprot:CAMPEP_0184686872 /NCGR_PEP_ID=MMETSP0312-20130426/24400_1 /TAXON_ID=31354 /ORGANISM="Compsopogon coeruleus, Strain SAG 36.94" /LENGTH=251 /DNA_ID=CAMNT_0027142435 /DNA_START=83 /DNA_END=838 /DNA_ORIENTATION=-